MNSSYTWIYSWKEYESKDENYSSIYQNRYYNSSENTDFIENIRATKFNSRR